MKDIKINKLIWPVFIELALQMLVGNIDQLMLSQYSDTAVAAVGNANMIMSVLILVFNVLSTATSILVSQSIGAKDMDRVGGIYTLAIVVNGILGFIFAALLFMTINPIYALMQVPQELVADATVYIKIVAISIPFQALLATISAIFRSNSLMKTTMKISIIYNIINIIGNQLLINGFGSVPAMGTAGVAISTVASRVIGVVIMAVIFSRAITNAKFDLKLLKPFPKKILGDMLKIGLPTGGENFSWNLAQLVSLGIINTFGTASITARTYVNMFAMLCYLYASACGQAVQVVVGYHIGAGDYDSADRITKRVLKSSAIISLTVATLLWVLARPLYGLLTKDVNIINIAVTIAFIQVFLEFGRAFNIIYIRAMQSAGDVIFPIVIGIGAEWFISVGLGYFFGIVMNMGLTGVWLGFALDECIRAVICHIRWKSGKWKKYSMKKSEE